MSNHTPGPWTYGGYECIHADGPAQVVASVYGANLRGGVAEKQANARLIAAAPETAAERDQLKEVNAELLAALRKMAALAEPYKHISASQEEQHYVVACGSLKSFVGITVGDIRRARAAIAKAEGKS